VTEEKDYIDDTSLKEVKFARSPIMSTHLVAFVVGEFDFVAGKDADDVNIRVYTAKGKASQGQFAMEVSLYKCSKVVKFLVRCKPLDFKSFWAVEVISTDG